MCILSMLLKRTRHCIGRRGQVTDKEQQAKATVQPTISPLGANTDDPRVEWTTTKTRHKSTPTTGARRNVTPIKATTAATATHRRGILRETFREDSDGVCQSV